MLVSQTIGDEKDQYKRVRLVRVRLDEVTMEAKTLFSPVQSTKDFPKSDNHSADICLFRDKIVVRMLTDKAMVYKIFEKDMSKFYPATVVKSKDEYRFFSSYHKVIFIDEKSFINTIPNARPSSIDPSKLEIYIEASRGNMIDNDGSFEMVIESPAESVLSDNCQTAIDWASLDLFHFLLDSTYGWINWKIGNDASKYREENIEMNEVRISLFAVKISNKLKEGQDYRDIKEHTDYFLYKR